jgi:hypothetical protein
VQFSLGTEELRIYDRQMRRTVEPGKVSVMVGPDSEHLTNTELTVTQ